MTKPFRLYAGGQLPSDFEYPAKLVSFASGLEYPDVYPWLFIDAPTKVGELSYKVRQSDGRNLIPFASVEDDRKDIACFDGDDTTGNPAVLMLILDDSGRSYSYANFDEWLEAAQADAERWRAMGR